MKDYLLNKAYEFYPKRVNGLDETYMLSPEIKKFRNTIEKTINKEYPIWVELTQKLNFEFNQFQILDKTNFTLNQPSFALQGILYKNENFVHSFSFYSSLLIPFYYYTVCRYEKQLDSLELMEVIINPKDKLKTNLITDFIKGEIDKELLSEEYLNLIIPEISFETIKEGNFKVINAFFNHKNILI